MLYMIDGPSNATDLGCQNPMEVQLRRPTAGAVFLVDGLSALVRDDVAESLRAVCPRGLRFERVLVRGPQPGDEPIEEVMLVSSEYSLHLLPSLVERRPDGTVKTLKRPWVLDKQPLPEGVGVFVIAEHPQISLFSEEAREVVRRHAPRAKWFSIPFVDDQAVPVAD